LKFTNLTRRTEIGANCYLLELAGRRVVLDCGMHPKCEGDEALPNFKALGDRPLDAILISHAHLDHIGTLPILMRRRTTARVFMTEASAEIGAALLHNSVSVMTRQRDELGLPTYPLYTHGETERSGELWQTCPWRQPLSLHGERVSASQEANVSFEFFDAGHVLGSAGILLRAEGRAIFYSGDVNFSAQTIMQPAVFPETEIDVLIMETTRGDTPEAPGFSRAAEEHRLGEAIERVFTRNGCVLLPVFALGKTQEVLGIIFKLRREKVLGDFPVYIGGLSTKMSEIYDRRAHGTRRSFPRKQLLAELQPFVLNGKTIGSAPARGGRVYALSSGMMTPKTLSNIFARRLLGNPGDAIFFVGYADPDSPAGVLQKAQPGECITLDSDRPPQELRCETGRFQFSAHASRESIVEYVKRLAPKKVVLVHGDPPAVEWMRAQLSAELPSLEVVLPTPGIEFEL
jgi:Cft2 family RNA processing exonuclease